MTASLVMNPNPLVLHPTDRVGKAAQHIMEHRYRNIPVVDEQGRYLGVVGVHCLLRLMLPKAVILEGGLTSIPFVKDTLEDLRHRLDAVQGEPVTRCLNNDAAVVHPDTPLMETLLTLYHTRSSVPVVEKGSERLVGMISYWDVLGRIAKESA